MTVLYSVAERNISVNNPLDAISPQVVSQDLADGALQFRVILAAAEVGSGKQFNFLLLLEDPTITVANGFNQIGWRHLAGGTHTCLPLGSGEGQWQAEDGTANPNLSYSVAPLRGKRVRVIMAPLTANVRAAGTVTHFLNGEL